MSKFSFKALFHRSTNNVHDSQSLIQQKEKKGISGFLSKLFKGQGPKPDKLNQQRKESVVSSSFGGIKAASDDNEAIIQQDLQKAFEEKRTSQRSSSSKTSIKSNSNDSSDLDLSDSTSNQLPNSFTIPPEQKTIDPRNDIYTDKDDDELPPPPNYPPPPLPEK